MERANDLALERGAGWSVGYKKGHKKTIDKFLNRLLTQNFFNKAHENQKGIGL